MTNATTVTKTTAKTKASTRTTKAQPTKEMQALTPVSEVLTSTPVSQRQVEEIYLDARNEQGIPQWNLVSLKRYVLEQLNEVAAGTKEFKIYMYPVEMNKMQEGKLVKSWNTAFIQDAVREISDAEMNGFVSSWTSIIPQVLTARSGREYQKNIAMVQIKRSNKAQAV